MGPRVDTIRGSIVFPGGSERQTRPHFGMRIDDTEDASKAGLRAGTEVQSQITQGRVPEDSFSANIPA